MISFEFMTLCECGLVFFFFSNIRGVSRTKNFTQWTSNERNGLFKIVCCVLFSLLFDDHMNMAILAYLGINVAIWS